MLGLVLLEGVDPLGFGGVAGTLAVPGRVGGFGDDKGLALPAQGLAGELDLVGARASPWALAVPARLGEPLPMVVLQMTRVGLVADCLAWAMAASAGQEAMSWATWAKDMSTVGTTQT